MLYALKVLIPSAYLARHGEGVNKNKTFKDVYGWGEAAPLTGLLLTIAMLNEFIEKILVHERDRKGSIQTTQEVEIYFNFVGRFVPPAFGEVELTPEELEEIRKREERKDRLHQNYLKRKASGGLLYIEDLQYHFRDMDPNWVVNHAYNLASYLLDNEKPMKDGDTIDGIRNGMIVQDIQWKCQYEDALIQPARIVMDVCMGEYAAGNRD